ncbi:ABC transporter permease [Antarcticibacterium sp. 1MA-6-2]|uniref:ABC transporter permease n=1 Tax=Antarcticibacterium sp. 1MA-6-2 TaxID=2908210 RepID=UPI001F1CCA84|nr:ABC transporter permease [Antarcticibacterium sp. 1MA-6-2]UJH90997.1 ABC transporter permease [Antarcticibacterium sp. 1MA-6-2]
MLRHKGFSFLNIAGLALGFTACFLIALFIWDEYQFDKFLPEGDRVYRVYNNHTDNEGTEDLAVTYPMIAPTLNENFPEVEKTARILMLPETKNLYEVGDKKIYEERGIFVDSTFFEVLPLEFKYGTAKSSLDQPESIVLSEEMAERYFGIENPVGKEIIMNKTPLKITGVFTKKSKVSFTIRICNASCFGRYTC